MTITDSPTTTDQVWSVTEQSTTSGRQNKKTPTKQIDRVPRIDAVESVAGFRFVRRVPEANRHLAMTWTASPHHPFSFSLRDLPQVLHGPAAPCGRRQVRCCWRSAVTALKDTLRLENMPIVGDRPPSLAPFKLRRGRAPCARSDRMINPPTNGGNRSRPMGCTRPIEKTCNAVR